MNRTRDTRSLLDRHNVVVAGILKRFRNIVTAATASIPQDGNTIEHASSNSMIMQRESIALISEIQGLLAINRELKALWMRGPLRQPGEDDGREAAIDAQALAAAQMYDRALAMRDAALAAVARDAALGGRGRVVADDDMRSSSS